LRQNQKERIGQNKVFFEKLLELTQIRPYRRVVTTYNGLRRLQTKSPYNLIFIVMFKLN